MNHFFAELTVSGTGFPTEPQCRINFRATNLIFRFDDGSGVEWSHDGSEIHGKLFVADKSWSQDDCDVSQIYFRKPDGAPDAKIRVWAWIKQR